MFTTYANAYNSDQPEVYFGSDHYRSFAEEAERSPLIKSDNLSDLAELGAALKVSAVPAGLTEIRRTYSGEAYAEHGRVTARLAPAKAAANRAGRRAAREALRRAITGDVDNATRHAGKQHFAYRPGTDPMVTLDHELRGEHYRRFGQKVDAWREEVATWETEYARVKAQGSLTAALWEMHNSRPAYPGYNSAQA